MALTSPKGPDRVLYGLAALLQNRLHGAIKKFNEQNACQVLFTVPGPIIFTDDFVFSFAIGGNDYTITFAAGTYNLLDIDRVINTTQTPLQSRIFSRFGLLFTAPGPVKFATAFGNIKVGQVVSYQPLVDPISYIISGVLPAEKDLKNYPAIVINLSSITPADDGIVTAYDVDLVLAITSPINSSQADFLSKQLLHYYDCIRSVIMDDDNGSLGGLVNGVAINSADIDEATGTANFLKLLTISLTVQVEED